MKLGLLFLVLLAVSYFATSYVQAANEELDYRFLPSKLIKKSDGIIQIFVVENNERVPKKITGLTATSLDSSIVRVLEINENQDLFSSEIKIKAVNPGSTTIFVVADGFSPLEIPITIFGNKQNQEKLLIETIPNSFSLNGDIKYGYVSVELADIEEFPVIAGDPVVITLTSSDNKVISLIDKEIVIDKGKYFGLAKFQINGPGEATIYATANGMKTVKSDEIIVEDDEDLEIELYTIPDQVNVFSTGRTFIIAQLQSGGEPVLAKKDIMVNYQITNSEFTEPVNSSPNYNLLGDVKDVGFFEIEKGSYWGYTEFSALSGIEDTYTVVLSTKDPLSVVSGEITTVELELLDDKIVKFETLPILATGNTELIGVVYLEDELGNPILAERDIAVTIESSDEDYLKVETPIIKHGYNSALVFAKVGHSVPDDVKLHVVVEEGDETVSPEITGPKLDDQNLVVKSLIPHVLAETEFPLIMYLEDGSEIVKFPQPSDVFISPSDYISIEKKSVSRGDDLIILNAKSLEKGSDTIYFELENYDTEFTIESMSMQPSTLEIDHAEKLFVGNNDIFSLQLLDSAGNPVFANKDIEVKIVSDNSFLEIPENIIIKRGEYYTLFDVAAKKSGITEISLLADEFPLITTEIEISSLVPEVTLSAPEIVQKDDSLEAVLSVTRNDSPLSGVNVDWNVEGGLVQISDSKTGSAGTANNFMIAIADIVKIDATVSGPYFSPITVSKTIKVNSTSSEFLAFAEESNPKQYQQIEVFGFDPIIIIVPLAIGVGGFMLRKKGILKITN